MKYTRRRILAYLPSSSIALLIPSLGITSSKLTISNNRDILDPETLKIIYNNYGKSIIKESVHLNFIRYSWGTYHRIKEKQKYYLDSTTIIPFAIEFNPNIISAPITFIMEIYNHSGVLTNSVFVAKYKTSGDINEIQFRAKFIPPLMSPAMGMIKMIAIGNINDYLAYACREVHYAEGEPGCC